MLVRMWKNWNSCAPLVGMQTGAAAVGHSTEVPQKNKPELPYGPAIPRPGQCCLDAHTYPHTKDAQ